MGPILGSASSKSWSIAFVCKQFMADHGINPSGQWVGSIQTMYSVTDVKTPFYKVAFTLKNNDRANIWMLGTESIGQRGPIGSEIVEAVSKIFRTSCWARNQTARYFVP